MKKLFFVLAFCFSGLNAFANENCALDKWWSEIKGFGGHKEFELVSNLSPKKIEKGPLSQLERRLILATVQEVMGQQEKVENIDQALKIFLDKPEGNDAGDIQIYNYLPSDPYSRIYVVKFYPGENMHGAIWTTVMGPGRGNTRLKQLASIVDGSLEDCNWKE